MPNRPHISVIMAVHNADAYLGTAIESILSQTYQDFEFLIHDDGSNDSSRMIIDKFADRDRRIVVSSSANQGLSASLNRLIKNARGEFLARMDADDVALPQRFEKQLSYLELHNECLVIGGSILVIDKENRPIYTLHAPSNFHEIDRNHLCGRASVYHPTAMIRRSILKQVGLYDEKNFAAEDIDLWLRIAEHGEISNLQEVVLKYRIHSQSISGSKRDLQRQMVRRACQAAWERRGLTGIQCDFRDWRMADTLESRREYFLSYGWRAWNSGHRDTWRHYALRSVALAPLSRQAWTLLIAGALKRPVRTAEPPT